LAQDDYYYEIQLSNKQLVFYFMAGATGLILSFLAGVMVGRGVDAVSGEVQAARTIQEDRIVAEETPKPAAKPATEDLTYAQRLEGEKVEDSLERARPGAGPVKPGKAGPTLAKVPPAMKAAAGAAPANTPANTASANTAGNAAAMPAPKPDVHAGTGPPPTRVASNVPAPAPPGATAAAPPAAAEAASGFTIQVGVFKEKARAEAVVARLKSKGFAPGVSGGAEGPWSVRVGHYADRAAAERDQARLRDEEKLQSLLVKR
jgi:cell division protein FtsN